MLQLRLGGAKINILKIYLGDGNTEWIKRLEWAAMDTLWKIQIVDSLAVGLTINEQVATWIYYCLALELFLYFH